MRSYGGDALTGAPKEIECREWADMSTERLDLGYPGARIRQLLRGPHLLELVGEAQPDTLLGERDRRDRFGAG